MTDPGSPLFDFVKTMAVLAGILTLAWAALRYWLPKLTQTQGNAIEVLARQPLEARKTLYVVRVGHKTLLLASAGEQVTLLDQVELKPKFADHLKEGAA